VFATALLAISLSACSGGEAAPTGPDLSANKVGAMATFNVGDQFKATEAGVVLDAVQQPPQLPAQGRLAVLVGAEASAPT
jgi:hypothetical protein